MRLSRVGRVLIAFGITASLAALSSAARSAPLTTWLTQAVASTSKLSGSGISVETTPPAGEEVSGLQLIQPSELANILKKNGTKPLILQVGFRVLYVQAHIPGSEYVGPGSSAEGLQQVRDRVKTLRRTEAIVLYCGCCPWSHCPNVHPAYQTLRDMGFKDVRVLFIPHDFGTDWVNHGYPVVSGEK